MTTRNAGLLLSNAAAPAAGLNKVNVIQWYGGKLTLVVSGTRDGATFEVMACARFPHTGDRAEYSDASKFTDADFTKIATVSNTGTIDLGNVNPCALAIKSLTPGANTRVKIVAQ